MIYTRIGKWYILYFIHHRLSASLITHPCHIMVWLGRRFCYDKKKTLANERYSALLRSISLERNIFYKINYFGIVSLLTPHRIQFACCFASSFFFSHSVLDNKHTFCSRTMLSKTYHHFVQQLFVFI